MTHYLFLLLMGALYLWGWNYGLWDLEGADEGRYVQIAKELLGRANWLVLTVGGEPYEQKPPLPFWLFAASLKLTGGEVSAWSARLPSVVAGMLTILLVFDIGTKRWGPRAGFLAGLCLLSAPLFARQTATARLDVIFTAWVTFAAWAWLAAPPGQRCSRLNTGRALAFWLGLTGAILCKGPLAVIAILGMLMGDAHRGRSWRSIRPIPGILLLSAIIGGWLVAQVRSMGPGQVEEQLAIATWRRLVTEDHIKPFWYYAESFFGHGYLPWAIFLLPALVAIYRSRRGGLPDGIRSLLFWIVPVLLVLHLSPGKRSYYLLPIFPPAALITAWYIDSVFLSRPLSRRLHVGLVSLTLIGAFSLLVVGIVMEIHEERLRAAQFIFGDFQVIVMALLVIILFATCALQIRRRTAWQAVLTLAMLTLTAEVFYAGVVNTARNQRRSSRNLASTVEALLLNGESLVGAVESAHRPEYHVYGDYQVRSIELEGTTLASDEVLPRIMLTREDARAVEALEARSYEEILKIQAGTDPMLIFRQTVDQTVPREAHQPTLRFGIAGDTGVRDSRAQGRMIQHIMELHRETPFDAFFLLGDNLYGRDPFETAIVERFVLPFEPLLKAGVPFYAALGNHDDDHPDRVESELHTPFFGMGGRDHYEKVFGNDLLTLFVLNSNRLEEDDEQLNWLRVALARSSSRWKVLALHHPLQASEAGHGAEEQLFSMLRDVIAGPNGVDLVLSGHNHFFERRAPVDGVTHITLGAGGKLEGDDLPPDPDRAAGYNAGLSFGWIDVQADALNFFAMSQAGEILDQFEIRKSEDNDHTVGQNQSVKAGGSGKGMPFTLVRSRGLPILSR